MPSVTDLLALLIERYPKAFFSDPANVRPLALGIHRALWQAEPDFSHQQIGRVLSFYTGSHFYLRSLQTGAVRVDLDGVGVSVVTPREASDAQRRLAELRARQQRKQKSPPPPPSQPAAPGRRPILRLADVRNRRPK